jgi:hypothetical protein
MKRTSVSAVGSGWDTEAGLAVAAAPGVAAILPQLQAAAARFSGYEGARSRQNGRLLQTVSGDGLVLQGDLDCDGHADFAILLCGLSHLLGLVAFIL